VEPIGGHAVYVDALEALPHIPRDQFPSDALAAHLYLEAGVRGVGLGSLAFAREKENGETEHPPFEYLRLAIPRRTYTNTQLEYVAKNLAKLLENKNKIKGLKIVWQPKTKGVRHFLAKLKPVN
jgi:tryptophanase